jgi:Protein involved in formate dehydrogenase formation
MDQRRRSSLESRDSSQGRESPNQRISSSESRPLSSSDRIRHVSEPQAPPSRSEPREIAELRRLKQDQPDLSGAADLQIELLQLQRRIQSRVSLPSIKLDPDFLNGLLASGPILQFDHLPIDWGDVRFLLRATATAMRNHDALDDADFRRAERLSRDADRLPAVVRSWYEAVRAGATPLIDDAVGLESVLQQAMRPFLTRAGDAVMARSDLAGWNRGFCPLCGGEPDLAVITAAADRLLICGRCAARWPFDQITCPFCRNADRARITSFASRDGQYRIYACDVCERYLKAYDARRASRPVMPVVDGVATLPLDAAAIQKGYK